MRFIYQKRLAGWHLTPKERRNTSGSCLNRLLALTCYVRCTFHLCHHNTHRSQCMRPEEEKCRPHEGRLLLGNFEEWDRSHKNGSQMTSLWSSFAFWGRIWELLYSCHHSKQKRCLFSRRHDIRIYCWSRRTKDIESASKFARKIKRTQNFVH